MQQQTGPAEFITAVEGHYQIWWNVEKGTQPQENRKRGRPDTMRQRILAWLSEHGEGLSAEELRAYLKPEKPIGDVLQGIRTSGVVITRGKGKAMRYFVA